MSEVVPLRIWPHDITEEQLGMILEAKATLDTDVQVIPSPAEPGGPGRVLAFGEIPPFFSASVPVGVGKPLTREGLTAALEHLLSDQPAPMTEEMWLSAAMGVPVTFVGEEDAL